MSIYTDYGFCPECGERRDLCKCNNLICEHFETPDNICCEYCNAYPICPLKTKDIIWDFHSEIYDFDWSADDWVEDYDYTEGDIGQDGII